MSEEELKKKLEVEEENEEDGENDVDEEDELEIEQFSEDDLGIGSSGLATGGSISSEPVRAWVPRDLESAIEEESSSRDEEEDEETNSNFYKTPEEDDSVRGAYGGVGEEDVREGNFYESNSSREGLASSGGASSGREFYSEGVSNLYNESNEGKVYSGSGASGLQDVGLDNRTEKSLRQSGLSQLEDYSRKKKDGESIYSDDVGKREVVGKGR